MFKVDERNRTFDKVRHSERDKGAFRVLVIAFDEEERILIVSFLPKSLSRVLWTSAAAIDRDARRFQRLGAILDWLCGTYSLYLVC